MAEQNTNKRKLIIKIILPIVLVVIIAGIWVIKANDRGTTVVQPKPSSSKSNDFVLEASKIDLKQLKSYGLPIIIDFGADSCIPCKEMAPVLKKLNEEWQGKVIVKFVDVWKYPNAAADFPLQIIPTQFFFDSKGKPYVPSDPKGMGMQMIGNLYTAHQGGLTEAQIRAIFEQMGVK